MGSIKDAIVNNIIVALATHYKEYEGTVKPEEWDGIVSVFIDTVIGSDYDVTIYLSTDAPSADSIRREFDEWFLAYRSFHN